MSDEEEESSRSSRSWNTEDTCEESVASTDRNLELRSGRKIDFTARTTALFNQTACATSHAPLPRSRFLLADWIGCRKAMAAAVSLLLARQGTGFTDDEPLSPSKATVLERPLPPFTDAADAMLASDGVTALVVISDTSRDIRVVSFDNTILATVTPNYALNEIVCARLGLKERCLVATSSQMNVVALLPVDFSSSDPLDEIAMPYEDSYPDFIALLPDQEHVIVELVDKHRYILIHVPTRRIKAETAPYDEEDFASGSVVLAKGSSPTFVTMLENVVVEYDALTLVEVRRWLRTGFPGTGALHVRTSHCDPHLRKLVSFERAAVHTWDIEKGDVEASTNLEAIFPDDYHMFEEEEEEDSDGDGPTNIVFLNTQCEIAPGLIAVGDTTDGLDLFAVRMDGEAPVNLTHLGRLSRQGIRHPACICPVAFRPLDGVVSVPKAIEANNCDDGEAASLEMPWWTRQ